MYLTILTTAFECCGMICELWRRRRSHA
jgi:hypothetical protein